ncbi:MAG TPA: hypothetical protein VFG21_08820 [Xanthomonadaceae bacterium]|nr:hypothetical protein [Xanthomonadaceae bacterium]
MPSDFQILCLHQPSSWLLALPLLLMMGGVAAASPPAVTARPLQPHAGGALLLDIHGEWAEPCAPTGATVQRERYDVEVRLAGGGACAGPVRELKLQPQSLAPKDRRWGGPGVYRVRVFGPERPGGGDRLLAFALLDVTAGARTADPEPGLWWSEPGAEFDHAGPGLGLSLERQGQVLSVTVFGYDGDGRATWLYGAAPLAGRVARIELSTLAGGRGPFAEYRAPDAIAATGTVHLEFLSPARAVAWFDRDGDGGGRSLHAISLVRFRVGDDPAAAFLGDWLLFADEPEPDRAAGARWVRFQDVQPRPGGFRLTGPGGDAMDCDTDPSRPNSPPGNCRLSATDGQYIDFEVTGLERLRGYQPDGRRMSMIRRARD